MSSLSRMNKKKIRKSNKKSRKTSNIFHLFFLKLIKNTHIMLLRLWQRMQVLENTLADYNTYRMYSNIVTGGA